MHQSRSGQGIRSRRRFLSVDIVIDYFVVRYFIILCSVFGIMSSEKGAVSPLKSLDENGVMKCTFHGYTMHESSPTHHHVFHYPAVSSSSLFRRSDDILHLPLVCLSVQLCNDLLWSFYQLDQKQPFIKGRSQICKSIHKMCMTSSMYACSLVYIISIEASNSLLKM